MSTNDILTSVGNFQLEDGEIRSPKLAPALDSISITSVDERQVLKDLHEQLVFALPPDDVAPRMYSKELITEKEYEQFQAASTKSDKNAVLLDGMRRRERGFLRTFIDDVVSAIPGQGHISEALKSTWQKISNDRKRRTRSATATQEKTKPNSSSQVPRITQRRVTASSFPCRAPQSQRNNERREFLELNDQIQSLKQELQEYKDKLEAQKQCSHRLNEEIFERDQEWREELQMTEEKWRQKYESLKAKNKRRVDELKREYHARLQAESNKLLNSFKRRLESVIRKEESLLNELDRQKQDIEGKISECSLPQPRSWLYESQSSISDDETWSSEPVEQEMDRGRRSSYSLDRSEDEYTMEADYEEESSSQRLRNTPEHYQSLDYLNHDDGAGSSVDNFETASLVEFSQRNKPHQQQHHRSLGRQTSSGRRVYNDSASQKHKRRSSSGASGFIKSSFSSLKGSVKNIFGISSKPTSKPSHKRHDAAPRTIGSGSRPPVITQQPKHSAYDSSVDSDAYTSAREDFTDDEDFIPRPAASRSRQMENQHQTVDGRGELKHDTPKVPAHMRPTVTSSNKQHTQTVKETNDTRGKPNAQHPTAATSPSIQDNRPPAKSSVAASQTSTQKQSNQKPIYTREVKKSKIQHSFTPQFSKNKAQSGSSSAQPVDGPGGSNKGIKEQPKDKSKSRFSFFGKK